MALPVYTRNPPVTSLVLSRNNERANRFALRESVLRFSGHPSEPPPGTYRDPSARCTALDHLPDPGRGIRAGSWLRSASDLPTREYPQSRAGRKNTGSVGGTKPLLPRPARARVGTKIRDLQCSATRAPAFRPEGTRRRQREHRIGALADLVQDARSVLQRCRLGRLYVGMTTRRLPESSIWTPPSCGSRR